MAMFLNNVNEKNDFIYITKNKYFVDKTGLLEKFNTIMNEHESRYVCITRPRRFGKTINAFMLASYYAKNLNTKNIFDKLKVASCPSYEEHLNKHNVIYISFNTRDITLNTYEDYRNYFIDGLMKDLKEICPDIDTNNPISTIFNEVYNKTKEGFIFIIDEWDYIFNKRLFGNKDENKENFLDFLENLLKDKAYVEFAYMTGVLPIAKYFSTSFCNMFPNEHTAFGDRKYDHYFGFTEPEVEELCKKQTEVSLEELKDWYDGYFTHDGIHLYNPRSVNYALSNGYCDNYWTNTGKMDEIIDCVKNNVDSVKDDIIKLIEGKSIGMFINSFATETMEFNTKKQIFSAMVVLGLLSYHNNRLTIPNRELRIKFADSLENKIFNKIADIVQKSNEMLFATLDKDTKTMEKLIREAHSLYSSVLKYNDENSLSCVITLIYLSALNRYDIIREHPTGEGYADFVFKPYNRNYPAFIIELKVNDTPENAIKQIKETNYIKALIGYTGKKLLVGITYNKKDKKHAIKIEEE